ncbi:hypothetical protein [Psittacicella gerlachiana]|uniref:Uncharacterized protein n=1 Tax=Psittacicella gerlachiana TaxID=2028574 RepID=A0A3A1YC14_9GAMM|nr:hypothetical protein [Psittacicella gerlachiana]RIY34749.1 hypothetical protein CKF59_04890 [Psittacicella gerlachiana]
MKIKSILATMLVVTTTLVSLNAQASTKDPATAYQDFYQMSVSTGTTTYTNESKNLVIEEQNVPAQISVASTGIINVVLGNKHVAPVFYNVGNVRIQAPAGMKLQTINQALSQLQIEQQVPAVSYFLKQAEISKKR